MAIQLLCECGKKIRAADAMAGKKVPCSKCRKSILLPAAGTNLIPDEADPFDLPLDPSKTKRMKLPPTLGKENRRRSSRRLAALVVSGLLLIGAASLGYTLISRDFAPDRIAAMGPTLPPRGSSPANATNTSGTSATVDVIKLDAPPAIEAIVPSGLPPSSPALLPIPPSGQIHDLMKRVADAYSKLTSYQDQTVVSLDDSVDFRDKTAGETTDVAAHSVQEYTGKVVVSRPTQARLDFHLEGTATFNLRHARDRGLNRSTEEALDWSFISSNAYETCFDGKQIWMTSALGSEFHSGKVPLATTRPAKTETHSVQVRLPTDPADLARSLLRNGYGLEVPVDRRWLSFLLAADSWSAMQSSIRNVTLVGEQSLEGEPTAILAWLEIVPPERTYRNVKNLSVSVRAWVRRKDGFIVKVLRDTTAVYPWIKEPSSPSIIFAGLPPEARPSFRRVVTETHRAIQIDAAIEPGVFAFNGDSAGHPIPIIHVQAVDEAGHPAPRPSAMLLNSKTGLKTGWHAASPEGDLQFDAEDFRWHASSPGRIEKSRGSFFSEEGNTLIVRAPGFATAFEPLSIDWKSPNIKVTLKPGMSLALTLHRPDGVGPSADAQPIIFAADDLPLVEPPTEYSPAAPAPDRTPKWSIVSPARSIDGTARSDSQTVDPFSLIATQPDGEGAYTAHLPSDLKSPLYFWLANADLKPVIAGPFSISDLASGKLSIELPAAGSLDATFTATAADTARLGLTGIGLLLVPELPENQQPAASLARIEARAADFSTKEGGLVRLEIPELAVGNYVLQAVGEKGNVATVLFQRNLKIETGKSAAPVISTTDAYQGHNQAQLVLLGSDGTPLVGKTCVAQGKQNGANVQLSQGKTGLGGRVLLRALPAGPITLLVDGRPFNTVDIADSDLPQGIELQMAPAKGQDAPDFSAQDLATGQSVHLTQFKGKIVMLQFFSGSGADAAAFAQRFASHKALLGDRVVGLCVCVDSEAAARQAAGAIGSSAGAVHLLWSGAPVASSDCWRRYQLGVVPLPCQYLIDSAGRVVAAPKDGQTAFEAALTKLLATSK